MLQIAYNPELQYAVCSWDEIDANQPWAKLVKRTLKDHSDRTEEPSLRSVAMPWWSFLSAQAALNEIIIAYDVSFQLSPEAERLLRQSAANEASYKNAINLSDLETVHVLKKLQDAGFTRTLTEAQLRNVRKIAALPAAASYSVPGAGKTTEALAYFFLRAAVGDKLLVVAPKNAFAAWDEQLILCLSEPGAGFVRLRGGEARVTQLLASSPKRILITYHQLSNVRDIIAQFISVHRTFLFLDESHRIKGGVQRKTAESVLSISHLAAGKLVLSGTPMPQADSDLVPQFSFLYPEVETSSESVVSQMRPIYVRTTKAELKLPPVKRYLIELDMTPQQAKVYSLMRTEAARQIEETLSNRSRAAFQHLGKSVMRLLAFVSNPGLLAREIGWIHQDLLNSVLGTDVISPKMEFACRRARELARLGQKSIIWTSFVENVEIIAGRLADLGAVYIHGGIDTGDEEDEETREGKIKMFHDREDVRTLVVNPAAASEGISLHKVCRNAIYVDRTFNAAHYLQSEDRIHRLGLGPSESPNIEILECRGTIDEAVRIRLGVKVDRMARALNDASLSIDPIPYDPYAIEDEAEFTLGMTEEDILDLLGNLKANPT